MPRSSHVITGLVATALIAITGATTSAQDERTPEFPFAFMPDAKAAAAGTPEDPTRILNGDVAAEGAWPWQVGLISVGAPSIFDGQFCGGSLIASTWVLTAAHCVVDEAPDLSLTRVPPDQIQILAGTNYLEDGDGELIAVEAVFTHPDYDPLAIDNDIALIQLAAPPSDPDTATIRLPSVSAEPRIAAAGTQAIVIGWGRLQDGRFPIDLRQVQLSLFDRQECNSLVSGPPKPGVVVQGDITENMICSGVSEGGRGSCNGDSGGPLMVAMPDGSYVQVGIVSWGYTADNAAGCSLEAEFSAFTRVARYQQWIIDTIAAAN